MFPAAQSALDFLNDMIEFSSCGPRRNNIGPPMITYELGDKTNVLEPL
jgi:hypothetical protein